MYAISALILMALFLALLATFVWVVGQWILGPFDRAGRGRNRPTRFRIVDFFCLIMELQVVLAIMALAFVDEAQLRFWLGGVASLLVIAMWYKGVGRLSQAGIEDAWRRAAFNWFVLPVTFGATLATVPALVVFAGLWFGEPDRPIPLLVWILVIGCPAGLVASRFLSQWILAGAAEATPSEQT